MKYKVDYKKPKKKGYSNQSVIFFNIEDAIRWENHVKENCCINVEVIPILNDV
jgi:hypothetical protein